MGKIVIVDYHLGNLFSVERSMESVGVKVLISSNPEEILSAERIIIPGVGAFGEGMQYLKKRNLSGAICDFATKQRPVLGICLGMQLLMSGSEELGKHQGLDLIKGNVLPLKDVKEGSVHYKIPHVGWNVLDNPSGKNKWNDPLLKGINYDDFFYFVHSFGVFVENSENCLSTTNYGSNSFCSIVKKGKIYGCQFHPEKSGEAGLKILNNFMNL